MALYGSDKVKISIGSASGSTTLLDISNYVDTINGFKVEAMTQETHAFGDTWVENSYTGMRKINDITLAGFYNDVAASGPHALLGDTSHLGADRLFEIDYGSSDIMQFRVIIAGYSRLPTRNELTRWEAVLRPNSSVVTAT